MNENDMWFIGLADRNKIIKKPSVLAVHEYYERHRKYE
jgi:hypothetical protein